MKRALCCVILVASAWGIAAGDAPAGAQSDSAPPAQVNPVVLKFLNSKVTLEFVDTPATDAMEFQISLLNLPLKVESTVQAGKKTMSLKLQNAPMVQALRSVTEKTGIEYRFAAQTMRLAMPDEWKLIDAGTKSFDELAKEAK